MHTRDGRRASLRPLQSIRSAYMAKGTASTHASIPLGGRMPLRTNEWSATAVLSGCQRGFEVGAHSVSRSPARINDKVSATDE